MADGAFAAALSAQRAGQLQVAHAGYVAHLAQTPQHRSGWINLGVVLHQLGHLEPAITAQQRALTLRQPAAPEDHELADLYAAQDWDRALATQGAGRRDLETAADNLAGLWADIGRPDLALPLRRALWQHLPSPARLVGLSSTLRALGRTPEALDLIAGHPMTPDLRMERAWARLAQGDWRGFADYEHRCDSSHASAPDLPLPALSRTVRAGDRLCVVADQGLGDMIWAARFLPALAALGAQVTLAVPPPLRRVLATCPGADRVVELNQLRGQFHGRVDAASLPYVTGFTRTPAAPVALTLPQDSRDRAAQRLAPFASLRKIGLCWRGNPAYPANARRSLPVSMLTQLAALPGTQLVALHKEDALAGTGLHGLIAAPCRDDRDLADTAAVIEQLDLVLSVDTAILHLAGSLNTPCAALLSHEGFWYWGHDDHSPWYPQITLLRQPRPGDWDAVMAQARALITQTGP